MQFNDWQQVKRLLVSLVGQPAATEKLQPALQVLRESLPAAEIALLTNADPVQLRPLFPWIDTVFLSQTTWQEPSQENLLVEKLKQEQFSAAILFTQKRESPYSLAYLCYLAEIPIRIGQSQEFGGSVLSHRIQPPADDSVDPYLYLLASVGFPVRNGGNAPRQGFSLQSG